MEIRVTALKNNFNNINVIRSNVKEILDFLHIRIHKLKFFYSEFIKTNKTELFIFGLDSFHFQSRLIDIEYEGMYKIFRTINNRMYCEYFKLYKIIVSYIKDTVNDKKLLEFIKVNTFPIYKDLEPEKEYKFETIIEIHENILILITSIIGNLNNKENEYKTYVDKNQIGLNIDNFVNTYSFEVIMMREKLKLFLTYIEFFHKLHTKYLQRFSNKIQLMNTHINDDIKFDEAGKINKNNIIVDTKGVDNLSILSPRLSNNSQKTPPSFLKKSIDSVNSLFTGSKNNESQSINLDEDDETLLSQETIDSAFSNIESKCNIVINTNIVSPIDDNIKDPDLKIEEIKVESDNINVIIDEIVTNTDDQDLNKMDYPQFDDQQNDDVSVLSLDSTTYEQNNDEEIDKNNKEPVKEEPKKKRTYKPRAKK